MCVMAKVDMSARGITVRLKRVSQLRRLGLSLRKAKADDTPDKRKVEKSSSPPELERSK
jgi:hypothetical protein